MLGTNANIVDIIIRARDQTKAAFASAKTGIVATKTATGTLNTKLGGLSKGFSAINSKVSGFGTKLKGLMTSAIGPLIGIAGIAAIGIALKKASDAFASFEQAAANAASVTGKTGVAFLETKKHIIDVSKILGETTVFKASEAADAFYDLASAGYDVANITKNELKPILDLAAATQTELKQTTEIVTSTLGQFGMAIEDSKNVADVFARTIGSSKATMDKLGISLTYVGPVAHALGRRLEETNATLGVLYNKGFDASMAGTALRGAMSRLMNPTAQVEAKLSELGVTVAEVNPETHSMADILDTLTGAGMDTADAMELFGLRAGPAMLALTESTDDIRELTTTLGEAGGAAETMAEQQLTTFEGQMKLVHSKIEGFMLSLGEMTAPAILAVANAVTGILPTIEALYKEISTGFGEAFESIARQAAPALEPLTAKLKEVSDKMSAGMDFKTLADDVGVFIGAALNPLIRGFTWLIDKLGPLWDLIGRGADLFHDFANALKTEEGRLDDIRDATEGVTAAKQTLFDINEKLKNATKTLADEIRDAGGWTESLSALESDAAARTAILTEARKAATAAIAEHGAGSEIARAAIEKVKIAEDNAKQSTENYQGALENSSQKFIDAGVATEGLQEAHLGLETASNDSLTAQENLQTAITNLATEIEESKQAPFDLGEAFSNFGGKVKEIFLELPLRVAEAFVKIYSTVAGVFSDLGTKISEFGDKLPDFLGGDFVEGIGESFATISDNFDTMGDEIDARVKDIRDSFEENLEEPLEEGVSGAAEVAEEAMDNAMSAVIKGTGNAGEAVDKLKDETTVLGAEITGVGEEAEQAYKDIELQVDNTEISIKNLSGELGDNADAFENMADAAQQLMDLDWSVFTEFEASLPRIDAGIGNMESSFVGLKGVLKSNIDELENVKHAVMDIGEISTPFLEAGFVDGVKAIGDFGGALSDAGSAINTFSSLQDVSIDGMINFGLHVHDMVSALEILESQMENLVPAFGNMDSLIDSIADAFLYGGGKANTFSTSFESMIDTSYDSIKKGGMGFTEFSNIVDEAVGEGQIKKVEHYWDVVDSSMHESTRGAYLAANQWAMSMRGVGLTFEEYYNLMKMSKAEQEEWLDSFLHGNMALTFQMDKQTNALKAQTGQLSKITDALQPYLEFMRTLNELAALSTLSTEQLNNGLNSINDTLMNLGTALSTFNLRPVMESLFGMKTAEGDLFTGGAATGFMDSMIAYQTPFNDLTVYVTRLSNAILGLPSAFDGLANISDSVLTDSTKLKGVFEAIEVIMANFSREMGGTGAFADKFATGMDTMLTSAAPLIEHFQDNNAAISLFNSTLLNFKTTISNVVDTMGMLKDMSEMILPSVDELVAGFDKAEEAVLRFHKALLKHTGLDKSGGIINEENVKNNLFTAVTNFAADWDKATKGMGTNLKTFNDASTDITGLTNSVSGLVGAFTSLSEMPVMTADAFSAGMKDMATNIKNFASALKDNIGTIEEALKAVDEAWADHAEEMARLVPIFKDATTAMNTLAGGVLSVARSFESLKQVDFEKEFNTGFVNLTTAVSAFATAFKNNIDGLLVSLDLLIRSWLENEAETVKLMRDFIVIASNFMIIIGYANSLQEAFNTMTAKTSTLGRGFSELTEFMNGVIEGVQEIYTTDAASDLAQFVIDVGLVVDALDNLERKLDGVMEQIKKKTDDTVNSMKTKIAELGAMENDAFNWGAGLMSSFIAGLHSMAGALESEVAYLAAIIFKFLGVGSNTKMGALSHLTDWPKNLVNTFARGIEEGIPDVSKALSALTLPMENLHMPGGYAGMLGGSSGNTLTMYNTWYVDDKASADYAVVEIERMLTRSKVL